MCSPAFYLLRAITALENAITQIYLPTDINVTTLRKDCCLIVDSFEKNYSEKKTRRGDKDLHCQEQSQVSWLSGLFCRHQAQIGGGADLSRPDETKLVERRQMFFDAHEMGCPIMGRQK